MATMKEIAELAGVSRGTVDRVLNGRGAVSKETEDRILKIAQAVNYIPNKAAKSLAIRKRALELGCIMPASQGSYFFRDIEKGIQQEIRELSEYGVSVRIAYVDPQNPTSQDLLIDEMVAAGVSGIALCGYALESTAQKIRQLREQGIPVVTFNSDIPDCGRLAYVGSDQVKAGRVVGSLIKLATNGKANVTVLLGTDRLFRRRLFADGLHSFVKEHAPDLQVTTLSVDFSDEFQCYDYMRELLQQENSTDILFFAAPGFRGISRALETVPEEKRPKIICFHQEPQTQVLLQKGILLATICQEPDYQGAKPMRLLFNYLALNTLPSREYYYTRNEIIINESL